MKSKKASRTAFISVISVITVCIWGTCAQETWTKVSQSPYAKDLQKCKKDWLEISKRKDPTEIRDCYHKYSFALIPQLSAPNSFPDYKPPILQVDPLTIAKNIPIGLPGVYNGTLTGVVISGLIEGLKPGNSQLEYNVNTGIGEYICTVPKDKLVAIKGNYDVGVDAKDLLGAVGKGAGAFTGRVEGVKAVFKITLREGKRGLQVASTACRVSVDELNLEFKAADPSGNAFTSVLSAMARTPNVKASLIDGVTKEVNVVLAGILGSSIHNIWKIVDA